MKLSKTVSLLGAIFVLSTVAACASDSNNAVNTEVGSNTISVPTQDERSTTESPATKTNQAFETANKTADSQRAATKTDTMSVEGEKTEITLKLYDEAGQVFTTYYPENDFVTESVSSGEGTTTRFYYNVTGEKNQDVYVSVSFPTEANSPEQLERLLTAKGGIIQKNQWQMESRTKDIPYSWAKEKILYTQPESSQNILAAVYIGEANGKAFYVITHYPAEYGDGFAPRADFILKNLDVKE